MGGVDGYKASASLYQEWYGGEKRFVNFVRGPLRDELADVSDPLYHPGYCAILVTPAICAGRAVWAPKKGASSNCAHSKIEF